MIFFDGFIVRYDGFLHRHSEGTNNTKLIQNKKKCIFIGNQKNF
jgi:hypothetical protein